MTQEKYNSIEPYVICPHCQTFFDNETHLPIILPCLHTFCHECVESISVKDSTGCPTCNVTFKNRKEFTVDKSRAYLVDFFRVVRSGEALACDQCQQNKSKDGRVAPVPAAEGKCGDCDEFLCKTCINVHNNTKLTKQHKIYTMQNIISGGLDFFQRKPYCEVKGHEGQLCSFFCDSPICKIPICTLCTVTKHLGSTEHDIRNLADVFNDHRQNMEILRKTTRKLVQDHADIIQELSRDICLIDTISKNVLVDIEVTFNHLVNLIQKRKENLQKTFTDLVDSKKKDLIKVKQTSEIFLSECKLSEEYSTFISTYASPSDFIEIAGIINSRIEHLLKQRSSLEVQYMKPKLTFSKINVEEVTNQISSLGEVCFTSYVLEKTQVDVFQTTSGKNQLIATVRLQNESNITVINSGATLVIELLGNGSKVFPTTVKDCTRLHGVFKIYADSLTPGIYYMNILVDGKPVSPQSYMISVKKDTKYEFSLSSTSYRSNKSDVSRHTKSLDSDTQKDKSVVLNETDQDSIAITGEINCPELDLDTNYCHMQNLILSDGKTMTNKRPRKYSARASPSAFKNYKGTIACQPLSRCGREYFEVHVDLYVKRQMKTDLVFEIGLARKPDVDRSYSLDCHPQAWAVCFRKCTVCCSICLQAWHNSQKLCHQPIADMCPPGTRMKLSYGLLLDNGTENLYVMNVKARKLLFRFKNVKASKALWPVFGAYSPDFVEVSLTVKSGNYIQTVLDPGYKKM